MSVVDRHVNFVCLSPCEFSLNLPRIFSFTHGAFGDEEVQTAIDKTAEGLLSVIATLGRGVPCFFSVCCFACLSFILICVFLCSVSVSVVSLLSLAAEFLVSILNCVLLC